MAGRIESSEIMSDGQMRRSRSDRPQVPRCETKRRRVWAQHCEPRRGRPEPHWEPLLSAGHETQKLGGQPHETGKLDGGAQAEPRGGMEK